MVPFPSPMEAEMGSRLLMPHVRSQEGAGVKELTVTDNHLTVLVLRRATWGSGGRWPGWVPGGTPAIPGLSPREGAERERARDRVFSHLTGFSFCPPFSRLTGEDPFEIRDYITSCLDQLSLMALPPCFFIEPTLEKGV